MGTVSYLTLAICIATIAIVVSQPNPNYVIDLYLNSIFGNLNTAYPLDLCVNTAVGLSTTQYNYAIYTCNNEGTEVTKTNYGSDPTCSSSVLSTETFSNTTLTPGSLNSFKCDGDASYEVVKTYQASVGSTPTCCEDDALSVTSATDVCYQMMDGNYSMYVLMAVYFSVHIITYIILS